MSNKGPIVSVSVTPEHPPEEPSLIVRIWLLVLNFFKWLLGKA
jgi:hypothetical protein